MGTGTVRGKFVGYRKQAQCNGRGQPEELLVSENALTKLVPARRFLQSSQLTDEVALRGEIQKQPIGRTTASTPTFEATKFYIALYGPWS